MTGPERLEPDENDDELTEPSVRVEITGLSLYTHHGVEEAERAVGQRLLFDLSFELGECDATVTDRVEDTVDDRLAHLRAARDGLAEHGVRVVRASSVYETEPQGEVLDQPEFLNACLEVETDLGPDDLLDACKVVEVEVGRLMGGPRHGPRTIDVDVLLLDDLEHESERLRIPHADVLARRFVLAPLIELDPDLALPDGTRLAEALATVEGQRVTRFGDL